MSRGQQAIDIIPPYGGYRSDLPMHLLAPHQLFDSQNGIFKDGTWQVRPGYGSFQSSLNERCVGAKFFYAANEAQKLVAVTPTKIWAQNTGFSAFANITDVALTGGATDYARFAVFPSSGANNLIITNNVDQPRVWDNSSATVSQIAAAPICKDVCVCDNRLIAGNVVESGVRSASRLRISNFNDYTTWPTTAGQQLDLIDSSDNIVCVVPLTRTSFVIYKTFSQWVGYAQNGVAPFRFEKISTQPGPCSVNAVIVYDTKHYYIGQDASVYSFDGQTCSKIGSPIQTYLRSNANWSNKDRIHGLLATFSRSLWWWWPSNNVSDCDSAVSLDMEEGESYGSWWPHSFANQITASCNYMARGGPTYADITDAYSNHPETYASLGGLPTMTEFIADSTGQLYYFGAATSDGGSSISAYLQTPQRALAGSIRDIRVGDVELFFKKTGVSQNVSVQFATTDTIMQTPTLQTASTIDISSDSQKIVRPVNLNSRFLGVKLSVTASQAVEFRGGVVTFDPVGKG